MLAALSLQTFGRAARLVRLLDWLSKVEECWAGC